MIIKRWPPHVQHPRHHQVTKSGWSGKGMDAAFMLFERNVAELAGAVERRAKTQEALRPLWHHRCGSHSAWLPRSCRNSCMNEASTSYVAAGRDSSRVSAVTGVYREHTGIRSQPT